MKTQVALLRFLIAVVAVMCASISVFADQGSAAEPKSSLIGTWLVTVTGEAATRTLIISGQELKPDAVVLQAAYGMSTERQGPILAELRNLEKARQLALTTQAATRIVAVEQSDGHFQGSFTLKNGNVKEVSIVRISEQELQKLLSEKSVSVVQTPTADVPVPCAAFSGGWTGEWPVQGSIFLWVASIDSQCTAKFCTVEAQSPQLQSKR